MVMYSAGAAPLLVLATLLGGSCEMGSGAGWDWRAAAAYVRRCRVAGNEREDGHRWKTAMQSEHTRGWREDPILTIKSTPASNLLSPFKTPMNPEEALTYQRSRSPTTSTTSRHISIKFQSQIPTIISIQNRPSSPSHPSKTQAPRNFRLHNTTTPCQIHPSALLEKKTLKTENPRPLPF